MPSNRAAEFSYYEELGIGQNASPGEIRESFHALVRLLHPDRHSDSDLKAIAERQLRRINLIYSTLSDPEKRRRYDASFGEDYSTSTAIVYKSTGKSRRKKFSPPFLWIGATVILTAAFVSLYIDNTQTSAEPIYTSSPASGEAPAFVSSADQSEANQVEGLRAQLRVARSERDAAREELIQLRGILASKINHFPVISSPGSTRAGSTRAESPDDVTPPQFRSLSSPAAVSPRVAPPKLQPTDSHRFEGFWFFASTPEKNNRNLYPPQYIEAVLTGADGAIHGKYRARYQVIDRPISPDVAFEFTGTPNGTTLATTWSGEGGAKGRATLTLTGENSLRFDWTATDLGTSQGLASGTAILTRRIE